MSEWTIEKNRRRWELLVKDFQESLTGFEKIELEKLQKQLVKHKLSQAREYIAKQERKADEP